MHRRHARLFGVWSMVWNPSHFLFCGMSALSPSLHSSGDPRSGEGRFPTAPPRDLHSPTQVSSAACVRPQVAHDCKNPLRAGVSHTEIEANIEPVLTYLEGQGLRGNDFYSAKDTASSEKTTAGWRCEGLPPGQACRCNPLTAQFIGFQPSAGRRAPHPRFRGRDHFAG